MNFRNCHEYNSRAKDKSNLVNRVVFFYLRNLYLNYNLKSNSSSKCLDQVFYSLFMKQIETNKKKSTDKFTNTHFLKEF